MHVTLIILIGGMLSICVNTYAFGSFEVEKLTAAADSLIIGHNEFSEQTHIQINLSALIISKKSGLRLYKGKPFNGEAVGFYPTGIMSTSQFFLKGKRSGVLKKWFPDGLLSFEAHYLLGQLHGENKSWWSNGNIRSQNFYIEGKTEGVSTSWYSSGEKFKKMNYVAGKEVGLQQAWRKTGELFSNYEYVNGRIFGLKRANMCYGLEDEKVSDSD